MLFFKHAWVPLSRFNLKPFGTIDWIPTLNGEMEVRGWALDRSGIRAVEVYIDNVKAADAKYGEPSPEVHEIYPYIPNSDHARFIARIDTSDFSNGTHVLLVRAFNRKGLWRDLTSQIVIFINEKPYDFWAHLGEAQPSDDNAVENTMLSINRESRRVLLQRSNSTVTFEKIPVYEGAFLKLGIGIADESGPRDGAGLVLEVVANSSEPLFAMSINPQTYAEDPKWYDERIDLRRFRNQVISLTLKTQSGGDNTSNRIGWSDLKIAYADETKDLERR